jgi:hypothetical protein
MNYEENRIPREVYWSGFGFQVWMQMMLQIRRCGENSILVLDEPDIYLHPELQKALMRLIRGRASQLFIATHSTEIVNEAEPGDILLVSRRHQNTQRISGDDGYKELFHYLGSSENAEFARIARARRIVFFEGQDRKIIRRFAGKIEGTDLLESPDTSFFQAGGFSQWSRITNVDWALKNMFGVDAKIVAIFDRDYLCDEEVADFLKKMNSETMRTFVLDRKEIENYAIEYDPLERATVKRIAERGVILSESDARGLLDGVFSEMRNDAQARFLASYLAFHRKRSPSVKVVNHLSEANKLFESRWADVDQRLTLIPGKIFFSDLSKSMQDKFGTGITINQVIAEFRKGQVSETLSRILQDSDRFFSEST